METASSNYDPNDPTWGQPGPLDYSSVLPNETSKTRTALDSLLASSDAIRRLRPPLPQVPLFPPRFGYGHPVIEVSDCLDASRDIAARYDFSGSPAGFSGSSVPSLGVW